MYAADAHHPRPALAEKLARLYGLRGGPTIDLTIRPAYYELLRRLGDPHRHLPPVIHVAGTNGKGSVIATMRAVLERAGRRAHVYTSPHLVRFNERIVIAGHEISDDALEALLDEVTAANGDLPLTFFEITTALAFTAFARQPADILLLETGLGGRLDCTNVIERPLVTVITAIGHDHAEFLGDTLPAIAGEKAGIMKRATPCVIAPQSDPQVVATLEARASDLPCPAYIYGRDWHAAPDASGMRLTGPSGTVSLPLPALPGRHQLDNAATALCALQLAGGFSVTAEDMAAGLAAVRWRARLERIDTPAARRLFPPEAGWELWVDGGHNEGAAHALAAQAALWHGKDRQPRNAQAPDRRRQERPPSTAPRVRPADLSGKPLHIVLAMMKTKDPAAFLAPLLPFAASITAAGLPDEELARAPEELLAASGVPAQDGASAIPLTAAAPDLAAALEAVARDRNPGRVLVTGSLYLAGAALRLLS